MSTSPIALDEWIISKIVEPVAWRIAAFLDVSTFAIARYILVLWPSMYFFMAMNALQSLVGYISAAVVLGGSTWFYFRSIVIERKVADGFPNPMRSDWAEATFRIVAILASVLMVFQTFYSLAFAVSMCSLYMYVQACNDMPPQYKRKEPLAIAPT